jgi:hypothetical protein
LDDIVEYLLQNYILVAFSGKPYGILGIFVLLVQLSVTCVAGLYRVYTYSRTLHPTKILFFLIGTAIGVAISVWSALYLFYIFKFLLGYIFSSLIRARNNARSISSTDLRGADLEELDLSLKLIFVSWHCNSYFFKLNLLSIGLPCESDI